MKPPRFCDLHCHSTASDGTDAPADLPRLAQDAGLSAFALTDHDTTAGLGAAAAAAQALGVRFVPGIEVSADPDVFGTGVSRGTLHLLGYYIDPQDSGLAKLTKKLRDARAQRNPLLVEKLNALGVRITYDDVLAAAGVEPVAAPEETPGGTPGTVPGKPSRELPGGGTVIGRPHIAQVLVEKGYVKSIHEAFHRYIGPRGAAYVRRDRLKAGDAIDAIHAAGGLVVLAHPVQLQLDTDTLEHTLAKLKDLGLDGVESRHSDHGPADVELLERFARKFTLLTTGGSDYHGSRKTIALGSQHVPMAVYDQLTAAAFQ